ncbi:SIR2 family protein [Sorangium sp. So ce448]|uniref:SIR2 family protein n=1 Tax=Sorangium sp. So ce448 TaxID=3133314 RepID=UPI003F629826
MDYNRFVRFVQEHFTDGLVLVIGSGLSAAEGIPGMPRLADHLATAALELTGDDAAHWKPVAAALKSGDGLEAALLKHPPSEPLESWIARKTADLLLPKERSVIDSVVKGSHVLRLTKFLHRINRPNAGLPIVTPNYDRLVELACEIAGYHVDTTAIGQYAGVFDHERSLMAACRKAVTRGKMVMLEYHPRALVLKPHGSFDWYRSSTGAIRCSIDLDSDRLIITPGLNKYKAGYSAPFDKHRDLANDHIKRAARLLIVGYGFNDDHLQTHLVKRIQDGTPTLILTLWAGEKIEKIAAEAPNCFCISRASSVKGVAIVSKYGRFEHEGAESWDLGILAEELLS